MSRRPTYSLSALFLLMTIVGVLAGLTSSSGAGLRFLIMRDALGDLHPGPTIGAFAFGGVFGAIVMAYNSSKVDMLALGGLIGGGIGVVATRVLLWPNDFRIVLGGAAIILAYALIVRLANPHPADDN